ncbi:MAG: CapA family protein [Anaerolineae bacterium]|nr:CapA family protein [Anaerolineae bacterium]
MQVFPPDTLSRFTMFKPNHRFLIILSVLLMLIPVMSAPAFQGCSETAGHITRQPYRSAIAETDMVYTVYTPPCYDQTSESYPVIYLLHGSTSDDNHWLQIGLAEALDQGIAQGTLPPAVVVLPFGNWIANENQFGEESWETVMVQELMPLVESQYRIDARREKRVIGGISRGGFWAFLIAFRHPDLFSAVGGHSAFFDPNNAPEDYNPLDLALTAPGIESLRLWLDRGPDDFARQNLNLMQERLNQRGLHYTYQLYPQGEHTNEYWAQHVDDYLRFYTADWGGAPIPTLAPVFATNTPAPTASAETGLALFLPAVSFPSIQSDISGETLRAIRDGQATANLVLSESTAATLRDFGISISAEIRVVADDALFTLMWSNRTLYTLLPFDQLTPRYRVLHVDGVHPLDGDLTMYPFAFSSNQPNFYPERLTRLMLSGVTALARGTREALDQHSIEWAGEAILPYTTQADFFHTSSEVSFTADCPQATEQMLGAFCAEDAHYGLFAYLGTDIIELTGNHNNDYGFAAYLDTLRRFHEDGFRTVGGGTTLDEARQPVILNHHGNTVAMVACNWIGPYYALVTENNPGAAYCDWDWLNAAIPDLAAMYDVVVVTTQYEEIEDYVPTARQEADFRALADLGADIIVGTQAHKPMTFAFYNPGRDYEAFIHYGMGNLFFDQPFWGNMRFFMDDLFIYEGRLLTVNLFTGIIDDNARPRPMTPDEATNFLAFMFNTEGGF